MLLPVIMSELLPVKEIFSSIQGEGECAGRRQIFIRLTGCNLSCSYCDTDHAVSDGWSVESTPGSGNFIIVKQLPTLNRITEIVGEWCNKNKKAHHSITITGGEPLLHANYLAVLIPALRYYLPVYIETNGTMPNELSKIISILDGVSMDIKMPSTALCALDLWETHRQFLALANLTRVSVKVVVSNMTSTDEILIACKMVADIERNIPFFIQPITNRNGKIDISSQHLLSLQAAASSVLSDVRVIPQMHVMLGAL